MSTTTATGECEVREATAAEGRELFDSRARELLGISGQEFLRRWDDGEYQESTDPDVSTLAVLMPFAR
jgi:hypothetical protein